MRKRIIAALLVFALALGLAGCSSRAVTWRDPRFERLVREYLGKPRGAIMPEELTDIEELWIEGAEIRRRGESEEAFLRRLEGYSFRMGDTMESPPYYLEDVANFPNLKSLRISSAFLIDISVLSGMGQLEALELKGCGFEDLSPVASLTGLSSLSLEGCDSILDFSPLAGLTGLVELNLSGCGSRRNPLDLGVIAPLTGLEKLILPTEWVENTQTVRDFTRLRELVVATEDGSILSGMKELEVLSLSGCSDLASLSGLTQLRELTVAAGSWVEDISPLASLIGLETLVLRHNDGISDISPLAGLGGLRTLDLLRTSPADLSPLAGLTGLESLAVTLTDGADPAALSSLTGLKSLWLDGGPLISLDPLAPLGSLTELTAARMGIEDISALAGLTKLERLDLQGNNIADAAPLGGLAALSSLNLGDNRLGDFAPLAGLSLEALNLAGNPGTNYAAIAPLQPALDAWDEALF